MVDPKSPPKKRNKTKSSQIKVSHNLFMFVFIGSCKTFSPYFHLKEVLILLHNLLMLLILTPLVYTYLSVK